MELNDLFQKQGIDPARVIVLRHRPFEPQLNARLPWLAAERPDVFNAYQQIQGPRLEKVFLSVDYVASFIGDKPGRALFVGLYSVNGSRQMTRTEYWETPENQEMKQFGLQGFIEDSGRDSCLWFDLLLKDFYPEWKGKLVIKWTPPELSWWRRAHKNRFAVQAVLEDSALVPPVPEWNRIAWRWEEPIPSAWEAALKHWAGIYHIFDESDGKSYVGSAYGSENLLGRWRNYRASGHGGNVLLKKRDPKNFRFSILERISPEMALADVVQLESNWKDRLHTRDPNGLNDN